jgi:hypothetical protein
MSTKKIATNYFGYRIIKKESTDGRETYSGSGSGSGNDSGNDSGSDTESVSSGYSSEGGGRYRFTSIVESKYKIPKEGSKQHNMTKEQIKEKLQGYKSLKTIQDKRYLLTLKPFKVWIRYFNTVTKEFRVGGLLKLVDPELRYIMLVNTNKNLTWSVQLKDNIIFVPKDIEAKQKAKEKENVTKEKLYRLYKEGKLTKN